MRTLFKVNDIDFINDGNEKENFSFIPATGLDKKFGDIELLRRIFTENIIVNPDVEPPTYPEIIQQLIDHNPQPETAADVAKILSLYNPADISEILKSLINHTPQPTTADDINGIIKSYPYELNSAIFDYKYLNWIKLGTGTITRANDTYTFTNAGVQKQNIFSGTAETEIRIAFQTKILDESTAWLFVLYTNVNTSGSSPISTPYFGIQYANKKFIIKALAKNNGTTITGTERYSMEFPINSTTPILIYKIYWTGASTLYFLENSTTKTISEISTEIAFRPKHIRIMANKSATYGTYTGKQIQKLAINEDNTLISKWNQ